MTLHFHMNLFLLALNHNHCEKDVLKIFAKFTGRHLCQSLFSNKSAGLSLSTLFKKRDSDKVKKQKKKLWLLLLNKILFAG